MIEIKDRYTGRVIYSSSAANTTKDALREANLSGADLSRANLSGADLSGADLSRANLSGADLYGANLSRANLYGANLSGANLSGADLYGANLSGADLFRANLSGADLFRADLSRANLYGANLSGADLSGAKGYNRYAHDPLMMLYDQPGRIVLFKMVTASGKSPIQTATPLVYEVGKTVELAEHDCNTNDDISCGSGINVATLPWIMKNWVTGSRVFTVSFAAHDIAAIPTDQEGKIRLFRCKVEQEVDLVAQGLIDADGRRI